jgi:hypothetical protein
MFIYYVLAPVSVIFSLMMPWNDYWTFAFKQKGCMVAASTWRILGSIGPGLV